MSDAAPQGSAPSVAAAPQGSAPSVAAGRLMLAAAAVLYITGTLGSNLGPAWIDDHPAVVLSLSSRNRNLFASVPYIEWPAYAVIGFTRLLLVAVVLYFVGQWYGHRALAWTENQLGELPKIYRWAERWVDRAGWALVVLMPGSNVVCMMAGHRRMPVRPFVGLLCLGLVLKLIVLWFGGKIFEDQIRWFLDAIEDYQWWIVGALFAISLAQSFRRAERSIDVAHEELLDGPTEPGAVGVGRTEAGATAPGSTESGLDGAETIEPGPSGGTREDDAHG
jgi:membrane protein DedA with SNARE-associated domain